MSFASNQQRVGSQEQQPHHVAQQSCSGQPQPKAEIFSVLADMTDEMLFGLDKARSGIQSSIQKLKSVNNSSAPASSIASLDGQRHQMKQRESLSSRSVSNRSVSDRSVSDRSVSNRSVSNRSDRTEVFKDEEEIEEFPSYIKILLIGSAALLIMAFALGIYGALAARAEPEQSQPPPQGQTIVVNDYSPSVFAPAPSPSGGVVGKNTGGGRRRNVRAGGRRRNVRASVQGPQPTKSWHMPKH